MRDISNVIIVGLGALGGIYAVKLQDHNPDCVRVLVDPERLKRYSADGVLFNGRRYDFRYVLPEPNPAKADLVIIATKADALPGAIAAIQPFVGDNTLILSLLNGVTSEQHIATAYGWEKVLYACFVGHGSTRVGNAITFDGVGRIVFGEAENRTHSPRVAALTRFFDAANITYEVPEDMLFALWRKFVLNVGVNQASAVLRASYGVFQRSEQALNIAIELMEEALTIARRIGIQNADAILPWALEFIRTTPPAFKSSMLQDMEAGAKTEVSIFGGTVCDLGQELGIPTPLNATFVKLIKALEEGNAGR